jgi:putative DNA primase/helicase
MTTAHEIIDAFAKAMAESGIVPPDQIIADGKLHRFNPRGAKLGDKPAYYVLHLDGVAAGTFGDWRSGMQSGWRHDRALTKEDRAAARKAQQEAQRGRAKETLEKHRQASELAAKMWNAATGATNEHPYLMAKGITAQGARLSGYGDLMIPMFQEQGICGLQFIAEDGAKKFLPGSRLKGSFWYWPGNGSSVAEGFATVCIAEGFATAASIREATGFDTVVAFNAGNLVPVARQIRLRYPKADIVICADDDHATEGNPGIKAAQAATMVCRGAIAYPPLQRVEGTDFNDVAVGYGRETGHELIRKAIGDATPWKALKCK